MDEKVVNSPGVKPIQRKTPPAPASFQPAGRPQSGAPATVKRKQTVQIPKARHVEKKSLLPKVAILSAVLIALGAAAVYLSGIWR